MTNKEAIEILRNKSDVARFTANYKELEAFELAIIELEMKEKIDMLLKGSSNMTNTDIEREFCQELWGYFYLAAADTRVDQDRLTAWVMVALIKDGIIEEDRFKMFFKNGMKKLKEA